MHVQGSYLVDEYFMNALERRKSINISESE